LYIWIKRLHAVHPEEALVVATELSRLQRIIRNLQCTARLLDEITDNGSRIRRLKICMERVLAASTNDARTAVLSQSHTAFDHRPRTEIWSEIDTLRDIDSQCWPDANWIA